MKRSLLFLVFLGLCVGMGVAAEAKTAEELRRVEEELDQKKHQQDALDATAREASKNLEDLRAKLIDATQNLQDKEDEEQTLSDKSTELTEEIASKSTTAKEERERLSLMVSALIEIASRPPETLFLQNGLTADHIHRSLLLHAILPRLKEQAENTASDLFSLYAMQTKLAQQKDLLAAAQENLEQQQRDLDQLIAARQGFLQKTEAQKTDIANHLAALSETARDLRQLMTAVSPPHAPKTSGSTSQGEGGTLKWPVSGIVRRSFGDADADGVTSEGLTLSCPSGAPIVAPRAGRVVFEGPFRGYGLIMILQHADGYHSFLSGFGRIDAEMGQEVAAGEPLGVMPVKAGAKPELYFEWRRGDNPIDPLSSLQKKDPGLSQRSNKPS